MAETGLYIQRAFPNLPIPVILTGAMRPLGFEHSDGLQNLTESLLAARLLAPGVYIVIHGQVFPADRTIKDRELGTFIPKPPA
jgi:L-asparaginase